MREIETTHPNADASTRSPAREWLELAGGGKIVALAATVTLTGALVYVALLPELEGLKDYRLLGPAFLIPIALLALLLVRLGKPLAAYHGLLWGALLAVTASCALVAGLRTGIVFAYPAIIVGAMVLGPRVVVLAGALAIAAVIGLGTAEYAGLLPAPRLSSTFIIGLAYVIVLFVVSSIAAAMVREQKRWRDKEARALRALQSGLGALTQREQDLRLIMNNIPAGICAFDGWVCRFANGHLAAYCGFSEDEIVGKHLSEVLGDVNFPLARPHVEQVLKGEPVNYRGPNPSPLAAGRYMQFNLVPRSGGDGKVEGFYGLFFDITRHEKAKQEIERLNRELEQRVRERTADLASANRELESFAYSISHDLRAPLRGIDGFSQMALEEYGDQLEAGGRNYLERVRAAAQRMGHLIDDILELSRVSRHAMRQERVDLSRLAAELMDEIREGDLLRSVEVSIAPGCTALGDPRLLRVLLQNLLENAWKYSARQTEARIDFGSERLDTGETAFFVRDNGVGFDMKYADRLFSPFQRLHDPKDYPGSGIGLATVARIAHRHGGRAWAESAPGQGATLRFTLGGRGASDDLAP